ncbi:rimM [Acrasis kona]|uniref:RimM n=1 Tax=Acrasis kona TaxID=1008807 RepID=A0AAW2YJI7_9EUKA
MSYIPILGTAWVATSFLGAQVVRKSMQKNKETKIDTSDDPYEYINKIKYDGNQLIEPELKLGPRKFSKPTLSATSRL